MTQSSLWRLGVGKVDAADMVYAADWGAQWRSGRIGHGVDAVEGVARSEVGAAESCSTRRTESRCGEWRGRATGE